MRDQRPEIDIDEFVLLHAAVEIGAVATEKSEREARLDAKLFGEAPASRGLRSFARTRMPAAGIRQQSPGMIFLPAAPLQQDAALVVHDEDRERAMQQARAMHRGLLADADGAVLLVDKDQPFLSHAAPIGRLSPDDNAREKS